MLVGSVGCLAIPRESRVRPVRASGLVDFFNAEKWPEIVRASAQALGNVGPGLGHIVGPAGNFSTLPDAAKWLLSLGMLLGRLELLTILVLFTPQFWRR